MFLLPHISQTLWDTIVLTGKVVGALSAISAAIYGVGRWINSGLTRLKKIGADVSTVMTNHLPHVEKGITDLHTAFQGFDRQMATLSERVEGMGTRLDEGKKEIGDLRLAFTQHLQAAAAIGEATPAVRRGRRKQAEKVPV